MRWAGHASHVGEEKIIWEGLYERDQDEDGEYDKSNLKEPGCGMWSGQGTTGGTSYTL